MGRAQASIRDAAARLAAALVPSARAEARILAAHAAGVALNRVDLLDDLDAAALDALVEERLTGRPLQWVTGTAAFRTVQVAVGPGVFIPRPETELVAGWAIERLARDRRPGQDLSAKRLVELCAGSGAISLAVAVEAKTPRSAAINATVAVEGKIVGSAQDGSTPADGSTGLLQWAVENSPTALAYLRRNLAGTGVAVVAGDMATALPELDGQVDVVVANPPYVPAAAWADLPPDVRGFDPREALVAGPDGLDAIRVVARVAQRLLRPGGAVVCEHDDTQGATAPAVFRAAGFHRVEDHADLAGRPRFSTAWK